MSAVSHGQLSCNHHACNAKPQRFFLQEFCAIFQCFHLVCRRRIPMKTGPSTRSLRRRDRRRTGSRASATTTSSRSRRPASRAATATWCASVTSMPASVGSNSPRLQCQICCVQKSGFTVYLHMPFTPVPHTFLTAALQRRTNLVLLTTCHRADSRMLHSSKSDDLTDENLNS